MPPLTYLRNVAPSVADKIAANYVTHIEKQDARIAELEERVAVQAATIRALTVHDDTICDRAFGRPETRDERAH